MRKEAIVNARIPDLKPFHVGCAICGKVMKESIKPKLFSVDHIIPASEPAALVHDWNDFFKRLNVPAKNGLQVLCHSCHDEKTAIENGTRKNVRSKRKVRKPKRSKKVA